jgi:predicted phosphodiesterase
MCLLFRRVRLTYAVRLPGVGLLGCLALLLPAHVGAQSSPASRSTEPNLKVAFIADQGRGDDADAVLRLIRAEGADMVLHAGDFDYEDDPVGWDADITAVFGADFPYFAAVGNHDDDDWEGDRGYQALLQQRVERVAGARCTGDLGVKSSCRYRGLFFILSGVGTMGRGHESYIRQQLETNSSTWRICLWHKNQNAMQVGEKEDDVGWGPYEACREHGAIVATGHEHSYSRTRTLVEMESGRVDPRWPNPDVLRVAPGASFVFVSALGGYDTREQVRCRSRSADGCDRWASIYTGDQDAQFGALFIEFHVDGDPSAARGYFKTIDGQVIDEFTVTADSRSAVVGTRP